MINSILIIPHYTLNFPFFLLYTFTQMDYLNVNLILSTRFSHGRSADHQIRESLSLAALTRISLGEIWQGNSSGIVVEGRRG